MGHLHEVIDTDVRFHIDPYTRTFTDTTPSKKTIVQYDHNSERYTFDMPRYIEGHDMMLCNVVEAITTNIDKTTKDRNDAPTPITDLHISSDDPSKIVFSWLISRVSTQYVGPMQFSIHFACKEEDGTLSYEWSTAKFTRISIKEGMNNREQIDYLNQLVKDAIERGGYTDGGVVNYVLVDENGNEFAATLVDEEVKLTATANDLRLGTSAITEEGYTEGENVIPAYHTNQGFELILPDDEYKITLLAYMDAYDFTKLQAIICEFNSTMDDSVSSNKIVIDDKIYAVLTTDCLSELVKDDTNKAINFGIVNDTDTIQIIRFFTYKEII